MDVELHLLEIISKLDNMKDILSTTHFQLEKIKDTSKETKTDVARLHVKLDRVIKEATKLVAKIQATTDTLSTTIITQFMNLKNATAQTLA